MALHAGIRARSVLEPVGDLQVDDLDHFIRVEKGVDGHELDEMARRDEHADLGTGSDRHSGRFVRFGQTIDDRWHVVEQEVSRRRSPIDIALIGEEIRRADRRRPARREPDDVRSPSCRLVPFGGQSLAGGDDTLAESLGQLVEIHDDVVSEDSGAFVRRHRVELLRSDESPV